MALIGAGPTIIALGLSEWLVPDLLILFLLGAFGEAMWVAAQQSIALDVPRHISGSILGLFFATKHLPPEQNNHREHAVQALTTVISR
ncbi:MAG: hypothetical protein ACJAY5_001837 [Actinomycetes bacterium]